MKSIKRSKACLQCEGEGEGGRGGGDLAVVSGEWVEVLTLTRRSRGRRAQTCL